MLVRTLVIFDNTKFIQSSTPFPGMMQHYPPQGADSAGCWVRLVPAKYTWETGSLPLYGALWTVKLHARAGRWEFWVLESWHVTRRVGKVKIQKFYEMAKYCGKGWRFYVKLPLAMPLHPPQGICILISALLNGNRQVTTFPRVHCLAVTQYFKEQIGISCAEWLCKCLLWWLHYYSKAGESFLPFAPIIEFI